MNSHITITGLTAHGYHGVYPEEKSAGQKFLVDLELHGDFLTAAISDKLEDTDDYGEIINSTLAIVSGESCDLIEHLAYLIGRKLLQEFSRLSRVVVTVHKPHAPVDAQINDISFTISINRE